ncbi:MAG TPA: hypothetical protein V6C65_24295 [Allocoleopsis sp.]
MKHPSPLYCPGCESQLDRETCPESEGWLPEWKTYKLLQCPCCTFFVESSPHNQLNWLQLEDLAISKGATRR